MPAKLSRISFNWNKTQAMSQDLVLYHRGIVEDIDSFYSHSWDFRYQDSSERIRNGSINSNQIKLYLKIVKRLNLYFEVVPESLEIPRGIHTRTVAGIVSAGDLNK